MNVTEQKKHLLKTPFILGRVLGMLFAFAGVCLFVYFKLVVSVPDVDGKNGYAALDEFELLGKDLDVRPREKKEIRKKYGEFIEVESQSLPPGLTIRGALVTLEFKKLKAITVPKVEGKSEKKAKEILDDAGFQVIIEKRATATERKGFVIGQLPKADEKLPEGKEVKIYVSAGAEKRNVPRVIGLNVEKARTILENGGFNAGEVEADAPADSKYQTPGTVFDQIPGPGEIKAPGTVVKIKVVPTPKEKLVRVPSVSDKSVRSASSVLIAAGFNVKVKKIPSETTIEGNVIRTTPSGYVAPGTTVTIIVSSGPVPVPSKTPVQIKKIYYCGECSEPIRPGARFCPNCRAPVR